MLERLFFLFTFLKIPFLYKAESSFQEKGGSSQEASSMKKIIMGKDTSSEAAQAISVMTSRKIYGTVVDKLSLQTELVDTDTRIGFYGNVKNHLISTWARLFKWEEFKAPPSKVPLKVVDVNYQSETSSCT